jgi:hypothetical protein
MYDLPPHLQSLIYEFDSTYHEIFNIVLLEFEMLVAFDDRFECILDTLRFERSLFDYYSDSGVNVLILHDCPALYNNK